MEKIKGKPEESSIEKFAIKSVLEPRINLKICSELTKNNLIHSSHLFKVKKIIKIIVFSVYI